MTLFPGVRSQVAFLNFSGSSGTGEQPFSFSASDPAVPYGPTFLSVLIYPSHQRLELCPFLSLLPEALSNSEWNESAQTKTKTTITSSEARVKGPGIG